jgi:hypothetical protein
VYEPPHQLSPNPLEPPLVVGVFQLLPHQLLSKLDEEVVLGVLESQPPPQNVLELWL